MQRQSRGILQMPQSHTETQVLSAKPSATRTAEEFRENDPSCPDGSSCEAYLLPIQSFDGAGRATRRMTSRATRSFSLLPQRTCRVRQMAGPGIVRRYPENTFDETVERRGQLSSCCCPFVPGIFRLRTTP